MQNIAFGIDPDDIDIVGDGITVDATGTVFMITRPGLYHVEWSVDLSEIGDSAVICTMENGEPGSALSNIASTGNCSSGVLINVTDADLPFSLSLRNFADPISIADSTGYEGTAASIRILRFADGPSV